MTLGYILISCFFVSLGALVGVFTLAVKEEKLEKILLYSGFKKQKALVANYLVALTVVLGGLAGFFLSHQAQKIIPYLLPLAAGGFIYISASDLMPELRKEANLKKSLVSFGIFLAGIFLMFLLKFVNHE